MAKEIKSTESTSIWDDFSSENLLNEVNETEEQEQEEGEEQEKEQEEEVEKPDPKKKAVKKETKSEKSEEDTEKIKKQEPPLENSNEESEEGVDDPSTFFEEVEKITGQEVEVDYGDIDPLTPQGIAIREKAVRETALDGFLEEIETNYPAAFKALKHAYNGGDISDLFKSVTTRDYSKVELTENDTELGKQILKEYYQSKGINNEKRIAKLIEAAEDSEEGLFTEAQSALDELKTSQAEETDKALEEQSRKAEEQKKRDRITVSAIDEVLESGKLGSFKIVGKADAQEFKNYVLKNIRRTNDGKYEFATPLDSSNLEKLLQYQYFQFKKGDLSKLIQIKASTENAQKLRLKLNAEAASGKKGSGLEDRSLGSETLNDFNV